MLKLSLIFNILKWISSKYIFNYTFADFEVNNKRMLLDLKTGGISRALALYKTRENDKVYLINKLNLKGKKILDLGANIGYYSLILSNCAGVNGSVYCIEPDPRNIKILKANCLLFGNSNIKKIDQIALSEKNDDMYLFLSNKSNLSTLINKNKDQLVESTEKIKVRCLRYQDFLKESNTEEFDFIRMDIEGYEQYLIPQIIETNPNCKILFEVHSINYRKEFFDFLQSISKEYKLEYAISTQGGKDIIKSKFNLLPSNKIKSDKRNRYVYENIDSKIMPELINYNPRILRYALLSRKN